MWETLLDNSDEQATYTQRLKVPGGWLVRSIVCGDPDAIAQSFVRDTLLYNHSDNDRWPPDQKWV